MIRWAALAAFLVSCAVPAYASCESIDECRYVNLFEDRIAAIFLPDEPVVVTDDGARILIAGTLPEGIGARDVAVEVTAPDGTLTRLEIRSTAGGIFEVLHVVPASREMSGRHEVKAWYLESADDDLHVWNDIASRSFGVLVPGKADHTVVILDGSPGCVDDESCYEDGDAEILAGGTIQWINEGEGPHRIRAAAVGLGREPPALVGSADTEGFFDTGVIPPGDEATVQFDAPLSAIYSCMFHPWMESVIRVVSDPGQEPVGVPDTVIDVQGGESKDDPEEDAPRPGVHLEGRAEYHAAGDRIEITVHYVGIKTRGSDVSLRSPDGTIMADTFSRRAGDRSSWVAITQPTWPVGEYTVRVEPKGGHGTSVMSIRIEEHDSIRCAGATANTGTDCYAGRVTEIVDHDTIQVGNRRVSLTVANADGNVTEARSMIGQVCPPDAIAVVDRDDTLLLDSRSTRNLAREGYSAVYCGGDPRTLNEQMIESGLAVRDPAGCLTTEFEWGRCPVVQEVAEEVDEAVAADDNCMIAFAVRGTEMVSTVQQLREFRDWTVMGTGEGAALMGMIHAVYYAVSPGVVEMMRGDEGARGTVYALLYLPLYVAGVLAG